MCSKSKGNSNPIKSMRARFLVQLVLMNFIIFMAVLIPVQITCDLYSDSISTQKLWISRINLTQDLIEQLSAIHEPSNHAFDTVSLTDDQERLQKSFDQFIQKVKSLKNEFNQIPVGPTKAKFAINLNGVHEEGTRLFNFGNKIIQQIKKNELIAARANVVAQDQCLIIAIQLATELQQSMTNQQAIQMQNQEDQIAWLNHLRFGVIATVILVLGLASWIQYKNDRTVAASAESPKQSDPTFEIPPCVTHSKPPENIKVKSENHAMVEAIRLDCNVLVVEDGPNNQRFNQAVLSKAGARVDIAEHGKIALEKVEASLESNTPYDIILMDIQMPEMDGYTATRQIREKEITCPIIAITANDQENARAECLEAGCDDYLAKPVLRDDLLEIVAKHLGEKSNV